MKSSLFSQFHPQRFSLFIFRCRIFPTFPYRGPILKGIIKHMIYFLLRIVLLEDITVAKSIFDPLIEKHIFLVCDFSRFSKDRYIKSYITIWQKNQMSS